MRREDVLAIRQMLSRIAYIHSEIAISLKKIDRNLAQLTPAVQTITKELKKKGGEA